VAARTGKGSLWTSPRALQLAVRLLGRTTRVRDGCDNVAHAGTAATTSKIRVSLDY